MSWRNILILLLVIAGIHLILIMGISGGCREEKKRETTPPAEKSGDVTASAEVEHHGKTAKNKIKDPEKPLSLKVSPWKYGSFRRLPDNLAKQSSRATSGIIVDLNTRQVLWEKNSRRPVPVASLTKLMTALLVAEKFENGAGIDESIAMSETAAAVEGRRFAPGEKLQIRDLIAAMMICSANDAATMLAEVVSGRVAVFVDKMNERALEMGLKGVDFNSPSGLPQGKKRENSLASASDILHLCQALMRHRIIMDVCKESYAKLSNGKEVYATNGLLKHPTKARPYWRKVPGLFGFKTGYTKAAGCCLAFGVTRNGRTFIGCVTGFPSSADRERFCNGLIEWAYKK